MRKTANEKQLKNISSQPEIWTNCAVLSYKERNMGSDERVATIFLKFHDIIFIEGDNNYSKIHLTAQCAALLRLPEAKVRVSKHLGYFESHLPQNIFFRASRECIVNKDFIVKVSAGLVYLSGFKNGIYISYDKTKQLREFMR